MNVIDFILDPFNTCVHKVVNYPLIPEESNVWTYQQLFQFWRLKTKQQLSTVHMYGVLWDIWASIQDLQDV